MQRFVSASTLHARHVHSSSSSSFSFFTPFRISFSSLLHQSRVRFSSSSSSIIEAYPVQLTPPPPPKSKSRLARAFVDYFQDLPNWARMREGPAYVQWINGLVILPVCVSVVAIHVLEYGSKVIGDEEKKEVDLENDDRLQLGRDAMSVAFCCAAAATTFMAAIQFGNQLADFGMKSKANYKSLVGVFRYSAPLVIFGMSIITTILAASEALYAAGWVTFLLVMCAGMDYFGYALRINPPWLLKLQLRQMYVVAAAMMILLFSRSQALEGQRPRMPL